MAKYILRATAPAQDCHYGWENEAFPIGNGREGAVIFGGVENEHIQFNEKTLWTGGPSPKRPAYRGGNKPGKARYLKEIRAALAEGDRAKAEVLVHELEGEEDGYGYFQNFGDLTVTFEEEESEFFDYKRELDIEKGIHTVSYKKGKRFYERTCFASFPHKVTVLRFTVSEGGMSGKIRLSSAQGGRTDILDEEEMILVSEGKLEDNALCFETLLSAEVKEGELKYENGTFAFFHAKELLLLFTSGTDYKNEYPHYRGEHPHQRLLSNLLRGKELGFSGLLHAHLSDYEEIFGRLRLNLGSDGFKEGLSVKELLSLYKKEGNNAEKRFLEELLLQYGRYLTIASSRAEEGALPSNLQGVWNDSNTPMWGSDYHLNINLQMNYWQVTIGNLLECALPLLDYVESLRIPGRVTAKEYMGIESDDENPENGFTAHTQNTIFGFTCPGWNFYWGWSPAAVPWILQNLWEYYDFSRDEKILREKIYPIMKEEVTLYEQFLIRDERSGRMVSSPSYSPEHGPVSIGNTYEQTLIFQLYDDTIRAAKILNVDSDLTLQWEKTRDLLSPLHIGENGQLKEWFEETSLGSVKHYQHRHRHISHLLGLYPGDLITKKDKELIEAAKISLLDRGDENTGWSMGHKINAWARIGDGEHAGKLIEKMIKTCILDNLWDTHPPFQIDGNFGLSAGILEMLIQSHEDEIRLLPALPQKWNHGMIEGVLARGGFSFSFSWREGKIFEVMIISGVGGECRLSKEGLTSFDVFSEDGKKVSSVCSENTLVFMTKRGETYRIR